MKFKILLLILVFSCFSCNNSDDDNDIPKCLQAIIDEAEIDDSPSLTGKIERYLFNEEEVFLSSPRQGTADVPSVVLTSDCQIICEFGGLLGLNTCPDFFGNAEFIEVVWENPR